MGSKDKPAEPARPTWLGAVVDILAVSGVIILIGFDKLTPGEGLPWLAAVLAVRLVPRKGSGTLSMFGAG